MKNEPIKPPVEMDEPWLTRVMQMEIRRAPDSLRTRVLEQVAKPGGASEVPAQCESPWWDAIVPPRWVWVPLLSAWILVVLLQLSEPALSESPVVLRSVPTPEELQWIDTEMSLVLEKTRRDNRVPPVLNQWLWLWQRPRTTV